MHSPTNDKDPFTGEDCTDKQCPVCGKWVFDLEKHARLVPDPEHAAMLVHSV